MPGITWQLDPTSEDATNTPLDIVDGATYVLLEESLPDPELDAQYASSVDTEGDPLADQRYRNTTETLKIRVYANSYQNLQTAIFALQQKAGKVKREGGTAKRTLPSGTAHVKDIIKMRVAAENSKGALVKFRDTVTITFESLPGWRAATETALTLHTETTLPCLVFTETAIKGDLPAHGRLVITDAQGVDQQWAIWGIQTRYYHASANAGLIIQAESRTSMGAGAAIAVGPSGASGAGSNTILANALTTSYQAVLSTQAGGSGPHLSHVGDFRVFARVQAPTTNTGGVAVALEWTQGDFRSPTRNADCNLTPDNSFTNGWRGVWLLADLGLVHLAPAVAGTQRWEGRILAKSTALGDDLYLDSLTFVPVAEGSGVTKSIVQITAPTSFLVRDEFGQSAGALAGKVAPVGGTWTGGGDADDFVVDAATATAQRTATGDSIGLQLGRIVWPATATATNLGAIVDVQQSGLPGQGSVRGMALRIVDASNFLIVGVVGGQNPKLLTAHTVIAGVASPIGSIQIRDDLAFSTGWQTLTVYVTPAGVVYASYGPQSDVPATPAPIAYSAALATGGTLATGKTGIYDYYSSATAYTRSWDNFRVWAPPADAAVFASQSLEVRHDQAIREDSTGTLWQTPSSYEGNYFQILPAGLEGRTLRVIAKACRAAGTTLMPDPAIDDISAQLFYTPRYLGLPE